MTTVPLIVEAIFRFIPSALVVYLFIDVNLTSRFNKYIQWTCVSLLYMAAGLIGQYLREAYNIQVVDFSLALILVTCYSLFFHGFSRFPHIYRLVFFSVTDTRRYSFCRNYICLFPGLQLRNRTPFVSCTPCG